MAEFIFPIFMSLNENSNIGNVAFELLLKLTFLNFLYSALFWCEVRLMVHQMLKAAP